MAISPGGRPADDSSLDASPRANWVEKAGGLPKYVRMVAHALIRKGMPKDKAIPSAINRIKRWAAGLDNVRPQVQAAAAAAIAEWEAKHGAAKGMSLSSPVVDAFTLDLAAEEELGEVVAVLVDLSDDDLDATLDLAAAVDSGELVLDLAPGDYRPPYDWKHGFIPLTPAAAASKAKMPPWAGKGRTKTPRGVHVAGVGKVKPGESRQSKELTAGDKVTHPQYGHGTIESASERGLSVKLDNGETIHANRFAMDNWKRRDVTGELAKARDDEARGRGVPGAVEKAEKAAGGAGSRMSDADLEKFKTKPYWRRQLSPQERRELDAEYERRGLGKAAAPKVTAADREQAQRIATNAGLANPDSAKRIAETIADARAKGRETVTVDTGNGKAVVNLKTPDHLKPAAVPAQQTSGGRDLPQGWRIHEAKRLDGKTTYQAQQQSSSGRWTPKGFPHLSREEAHKEVPEPNALTAQERDLYKRDDALEGRIQSLAATGRNPDGQLERLRAERDRRKAAGSWSPDPNRPSVGDEAAARSRVNTPGGGSYPTKADGSPDYGAMSAEQAATIRANLAGRGVGARVDTDRGPGTVKSVSTRGTTIEPDAPGEGAFHVAAGTPGHDRIVPIGRKGEQPGDVGSTAIGKSRPDRDTLEARRKAALNAEGERTLRNMADDVLDHNIKTYEAAHRKQGLDKPEPKTLTALKAEKARRAGDKTPAGFPEGQKVVYNGRRGDGTGTVTGTRNVDGETFLTVKDDKDGKTYEWAPDQVKRNDEVPLGPAHYAGADGPTLAAEAERRGLGNRQMLSGKSDSQLRTMLRDHDRNPDASHEDNARARATSSRSTNPDAPIRIEHTPDGTLVHGTTREDAAAIKEVGGFKWSRNLNAWYLPRTWREDTRSRKVQQLEAKLGDKAGVDRVTGPRMSAAERDAEKRARAADRATRMDSRAEKQSAEAARRFEASDLREEKSGIPFGQPILVGHHSERRHRAAIDRAHANLGKGVEAQREAERAQEAADRARRTASGSESKVTIGNRIARNEADLRDVERKLNGSSSQLRGPATGDYRDRLLRRKADLEDTIQHDKGKLEAAGGVPSKDTVSPGDFVKVRGQWYPVTKANAKTVGVPNAMIPGRSNTSPWHEVQEHRKAGDVSREDVARMIQSTSQAFPNLKTELAKAAPTAGARERNPATDRRLGAGMRVEDRQTEKAQEAAVQGTAVTRDYPKGSKVTFTAGRSGETYTGTVIGHTDTGTGPRVKVKPDNPDLPSQFNLEPTELRKVGDPTKGTGRFMSPDTARGITEDTARKMTDDQLERAMQRLMQDGTYSGPAFKVLEDELNRRDAARAEGNRRGR